MTSSMLYSPVTQCCNLNGDRRRTEYAKEKYPILACYNALLMKVNIAYQKH